LSYMGAINIHPKKEKPEMRAGTTDTRSGEELDARETEENGYWRIRIVETNRAPIELEPLRGITLCRIRLGPTKTTSESEPSIMGAGDSPALVVPSAAGKLKRRFAISNAES